VRECGRPSLLDKVGARCSTSGGDMELLAWWNEQFETEHSSLSDLSDGVVYLQLLDALSPGSVELRNLSLAPLTVDERARNLSLFKVAARRLGVDTGGEVDVSALARGDPEAHSRLATALREVTERSADTLDAIDGYPALKARMEARAFSGHPPESAAEGQNVSQRRDELDQLIDCLEQELAKRMQALEETQTDFYEARHERGLLFTALQRVERVCVDMVAQDPADPLAGDLLAIAADMPDDWRPADDDFEEDAQYQF